MAYNVTCLFFLTSLLLFNCVQATITTKGRRFIVDEGDNVELPCNIRDIGMLMFILKIK